IHTTKNPNSLLLLASSRNVGLAATTQSPKPSSASPSLLTRLHSASSSAACKVVDKKDAVVSDGDLVAMMKRYLKGEQFMLARIMKEWFIRIRLQSLIASRKYGYGDGGDKIKTDAECLKELLGECDEDCPESDLKMAVHEIDTWEEKYYGEWFDEIQQLKNKYFETQQGDDKQKKQNDDVLFSIRKMILRMRLSGHFSDGLELWSRDPKDTEFTGDIDNNWRIISSRDAFFRSYSEFFEDDLLSKMDDKVREVVDLDNTQWQLPLSRIFGERLDHTILGMEYHEKAELRENAESRYLLGYLERLEIMRAKPEEEEEEVSSKSEVTK
ncbi:unnamed protein product, partial [Linum tenue]